MAAADAARKGTPPPSELLLAWRCRQWRAMPEAGGLNQQPAGLIEKMTQTLNTYNACKEWSRHSTDGKWLVENKDIVEFIAQLEKMRKDGE